MFLGYIFGFFFIKLLRFESDDEKKAFHFQCVMNNYSFVPLPLALIFFGEKGAAVVILCSLGAEFAIWTLGLASLQGFSIDKKMLKIFSVPPMLALYLSIFLILISGFTDINFKNSSSSLLKNLMITIRMIGGATIPVAMIVCGGRMGLAPVSRIFRANVFILSFVRLVIIPAAIILILSLLPIDALYFKVISIIAVMPTAIASIVMSEIYGGDKDFMTATVLVTNIAGLVTIPIILFFVL
jgi:predicted permease